MKLKVVQKNKYTSYSSGKRLSEQGLLIICDLVSLREKNLYEIYHTDWLIGACAYCLQQQEKV